MLRTYTLLLLLLAICQNSFAQKQTNLTNSSYRSRLIGKATRWYSNTVDTNWYMYSAGRGDDHSTQPIHYDTSVQWTTYYSKLKYYNTYDSHDSILVTIMEDSSFCTGCLPGLKRITYVRNTTQQRTSDTFEVFFNNKWNYSEVNEYEYDTRGKKIRTTNFGYDIPQAAFYKLSEITYTYNTGDSITAILEKRLNVSSLQNTTLQYYTYNTAGKREHDYVCYWNKTTSAFDTTYVFNYIWAADGTLTEKQTYNYISPNHWDSVDREAYHYDANKNLIKKRYFFYNSGFREVTNNNYVYDANDNLIYTEVMVSDVNNNWHLDGNNPPKYYYWESYTPVNVAKLPQQGGRLNIYPNPATNLLHINVSWYVPQAYTTLVADMQGRILLHCNSCTQLDIGTLPAGNYNLILKGEQNTMLHTKLSVTK